MKAMLVAAGLGTRLRPFTAERPKCMVPVAGKPVLQWNIEFLRSHGIVDLVINLHLNPQAVVDHFQDGSAMGVRIAYSYEPELMGTAGAVWAARRFLTSERFWVIYADNILNCRLDRMAALHQAAQATLTMGLFWREDVSASGVASLDGDNRISGFKEKPAVHEALSHWVNAGLYLCESRIMQFIPSGQVSDFGHDILPALLAAGEPLYGYNFGPGETLHWIDTPADLARTAAVLGGTPVG